MSKIGFTLGLYVVVIILCVSTTGFTAPIGTEFTYQGRLTDQGSLANGYYDFEFGVYDVENLGSPISTDTLEDVAVENGYFTVELDFGGGVFTGDVCWLEIGVRPGAETGSFTTLNDRQKLTPTPYAHYALHGTGGAGLWTTNANDIYNTNSGNVGIGTTDPMGNLHVSTTPAYGDIAFFDAGGGQDDLSIDLDSAYTSSVDRLYIIEVTDSSGDPDKFRWSGDNGVTWSSDTLDMTTNWYDLSYGVRIRWDNTDGHDDGGVSTGDVWGWYAFTNHENSLVVREGKTGIGTASPMGRLHVSTEASYGDIIFFANGWGLNDLSVDLDSVYSDDVDRIYIVEVVGEEDDIDQFQWSDDGGLTWSSELGTTTSWYDLSYGVRIKWDETEGHYDRDRRTGDKWAWVAYHSRDSLVVVDGKVGIGTTTPAWELEVANLTPGDGAESAVKANDAGGAIAAYSSTLGDPYTHLAGRVSLFSDGASNGLDLRADGSLSDMRFYTGGLWPANERMRISSTGGLRITSYRDDGLGSWEEGLFFTNNSNGMGPWSQAGIWADGVSGFNGELAFGVDGDDINNLTGIQEAMRINKFGSVGIGTKYPGHKLHINNIDAMSGGIARFSNDQGIYLDIGVTGSNTGWIVGNNRPYIFTENKNLVILTGSGDVGIGTAYPHDGRLCIANSETNEAYISLDPGGAANNDIMGVRVSESGNSTTKMHFGREFTYDSEFKNLVTIEGISGNVGIGTSNPTEKLTVRGNLLIISESSSDPVLELGEGLDYAEGFDVSAQDKISAGSVLVIDADNPGKLAISNKSYDTKVAGIVAGAQGLGSGVRLGAGQFDYDVALAGRVYCKADATDEAIHVGDLLTTSATPGYAMKAVDHTRSHGAILGKAMESMEKGQKGQILVLVTLQ